jgi:hypothetical protein
MTFPAAPINGQQATVNGITYVYVSSKNAWNRTTGSFSVIGDITLANVSYKANSAIPKSYADSISVVFGF